MEFGNGLTITAFFLGQGMYQKAFQVVCAYQMG